MRSECTLWCDENLTGVLIITRYCIDIIIVCLFIWNVNQKCFSGGFRLSVKFGYFNTHLRWLRKTRLYRNGWSGPCDLRVWTQSSLNSWKRVVHFRLSSQKRVSTLENVWSISSISVESTNQKIAGSVFCGMVWPGEIFGADAADGADPQFGLADWTPR